MSMPAAAPPHVAILLITFQRQAGLAALLAAIAKQTGLGSNYRISVVVCDNDAAQSARTVALAAGATYVSEPRRGIPFARNAALDAVPEDADFICFIDDDEAPPPGWMSALLAVQRQTGAGAVLGPVVPVFPVGSESRWAVRSGLLQRRRNRDGARIYYGATNNTLVSWPFVRDHGLRFDERMRFTGGSDFRFFRLAMARGLTIHWAEAAMIEEAFPPERLRLSWVLARQFRTGNTYAIHDRLEGGAGRLVKRFGTGVARIALGIVMLPALPFSARRGGRALTHILRGAGMISGLFGGVYEEYRPR
jgi:glycosyltransferase involved in cell wall biosynthesis